MERGKGEEEVGKPTDWPTTGGRGEGGEDLTSALALGWSRDQQRSGRQEIPGNRTEEEKIRERYYKPNQTLEHDTIRTGSGRKFSQRKEFDGKPENSRENLAKVKHTEKAAT